MKKTQRLLRFGAIFCIFMVLLFTFASAKRSRKQCYQKKKPLQLISVHIVDRNGFSEAITNKDRLGQYQKVDFLQPQSYQKVLRIYARDGKGNMRSVVTSYHENGNPKQFLEILNGRASGQFCEWHENGTMSVYAQVLNGSPDIANGAEKTWVFDGLSCIWDENGHNIAQISYSQGSLEGFSYYFHTSGNVWKIVPYHNNEVNGTMEIYKDSGELLQKVSYSKGLKNGESYRYWNDSQVASYELFNNGKLEKGEYFDKEGQSITEINSGDGYRAIFGKEAVCELQTYKDGYLDGQVQVYNPQGKLKRIYHIKNNIKNGEETEYYVDENAISEEEPKPKLSFNWYEGKVHGIARTWYPNGNLESQREMANNEKNGILTASYRDGNLMLIEEYEKNKLVRGDYFKIGDRVAISEVREGKGTATIFDANGQFIHKIVYERGMPTG